MLDAPLKVSTLQVAVTVVVVLVVALIQACGIVYSS